MSNASPNHVAHLPPASTTNYDLRQQAAALGARLHRRSAPRGEPGIEERRVREVYDDEPVREAAPAHEQRPMRLSELAEAIARAKRGRREIAESRDPDGADDGGYDPREIVRSRLGGASMAARVVGALHQRGVR